MTCEHCGATDLSWVDERFGHCRRRGAQARRGRDERVEGHHPGIGHVTGARDLQRKIDQARREGKRVTLPDELGRMGDNLGPRPRVENGKPTAWERTLKDMGETE